MLQQLFIENIKQLNIDQFADQRIVVKGCGDITIGEYAYLEITKRLRPVAKKYNVWRTLQHCAYL